MKQWTTKEVARLKLLYPTASKAEIIEQMSPRAWRAILNKAWLLGLARRGRGKWEKIAAAHIPVFVLPTDVPVEVKYERPWS